MAKRKSTSKNASKKLPLELILLLLGIILAVGIIGSQTSWFNFASSQSDQALENLNSTTDSLGTINADGTMGPETATENWSNSLADSEKGTLEFAIIDPPAGGKPDNPGHQGRRPTESYHPKGDDHQGSPSGRKGDHGPQTLTALNLTIAKVEVHMASQGTPGNQKMEKGKPEAKPEKKEKVVSHWETLDLPTPVTLDLVELAKTKEVSKLGLTDLGAGRYTEVRLYVSSASATLENGQTVDVKVLGKDNIVRVVRSFKIEAGQTTTLTMDINAQRSVIRAGDMYLLKPVVAKLLVEKKTP